MSTLLPELYEAYVRPDLVKVWETWRINNSDKVKLEARAEQLFQDSKYEWRLFRVLNPVLYPDSTFGMPFIARAGQKTRPPDVIDVQPIDPEDFLPKVETTLALGSVGVLLGIGLGVAGVVFLAKKVL